MDAKKQYSAEEVAAMLMKDNPEVPQNAFAIYKGDSNTVPGDDKTAVGVWHFGLRRYIPFVGKLVTGGWMRLPPGELHINDKSVWEQDKWQPCGCGKRPEDSTYVGTVPQNGGS